MFLHDARNSGRAADVLPDKASIIWNRAIGQSDVTGIAIGGDGTIYVGNADHSLYALDSSDGSEKWSFQAGHSIVGSPAIDSDGNIYVGAKDGYLYCINANGTLRWKYNAQYPISSSPIISPFNAILLTTTSRFYAISPSGISLWNDWLGAGLPYGSISSPAVGSDGTVYSCGSSIIGGPDSLRAFDSDGTLKWSVSIDQVGTSAPAIGDNGVIYCAAGHMAGGGPYGLYAVNPNGTVAWSYSLQDMPYMANPTIGPDGTVYVGCDDYFLYAIRPDGSLKWRFLLTDSMNGSSCAIDGAGMVLANDGSGSVYALSPDGTVKWRLDATPPDRFYRTAVISSGGYIYMPGGDGIVAIGPRVEEQKNDSSGGGSNGGCFLVAATGDSPDGRETCHPRHVWARGLVVPALGLSVLGVALLRNRRGRLGGQADDDGAKPEAW
ncbi:MAG: PQQ-binding-like beta-propeller repeat protein [Planctomycetes bacterium]|nr:PQQ-binding-like beta-propeller repeat protein [Planctomycetota bacterium]